MIRFGFRFPATHLHSSLQVMLSLRAAQVQAIPRCLSTRCTTCLPSLNSWPPNLSCRSFAPGPSRRPLSSTTRLLRNGSHKIKSKSAPSRAHKPWSESDTFVATRDRSDARVVAYLRGHLTDWAGSGLTRRRVEQYGFSAHEAADAVRQYVTVVESALEANTLPAYFRGVAEEPDRVQAAESALLRTFLIWCTDPSILPSSTGPSSAKALELPPSLISHLQAILQITDLSRCLYEGHLTHARSLSRKFHLHIGPTNSGKTHQALLALTRAEVGAYAGPLRLLAHEIWERLNLGTVGAGPRACNLLTGEERRIVSPDAGLMSCTVEMLPDSNFGEPYDVVVIDEIQMLADSHRGGSWTERLVGVVAKEIHLCGDESTLSLLQELIPAMGDTLEIHRYDRLTPLEVSPALGHWSKVRTGDCVVVFSRTGIFEVKRKIEQESGRSCAVVYGALPPETRAEQARDFNEGRREVLVASDAVGMGLNL